MPAMRPACRMKRGLSGNDVLIGRQTCGKFPYSMEVFMKNKQTQLVDTVEKVDELIERVRKAQQIYATYTQEQVDKIFFEAAIAANMKRIPLAKMAVEETGMGIVEDKTIKNHFASEYIYNAYRDVKTCGVIEDDRQFGIRKIAEPVGLICAIVPTTNPTSTAIFKCLMALKTRNGIIVSPHHRAKKSTAEAARVVLEAAVAAGAPEDIIGWIDVPARDLTRRLMENSDLILATGGPNMVHAAYSSGTPAVGVGAGNTPAVIDEFQSVRQRHDLRLRAVGYRAGGNLRAGQG